LSITEELKALLAEAGCTLYGFSDITVLPKAARKNMPVGIILGCALTHEGVKENEAGVKMLVNPHGGNTFEPLEQYTQAVTAFLQQHGYKTRTDGYVQSIVTDKTVATLGGLGWIGKCALLTTPKTGPALRLGVILTNAPLECNEPITKSQCPPNCHVCQNICPANAISGKLWERGVHRDEFFNVEACKKHRKKQEYGLCWLCIAACPLAVASAQ
jgi:epoxyqueuosine reductase QueG